MQGVSRGGSQAVAPKLPCGRSSPNCATATASADELTLCDKCLGCAHKMRQWVPPQDRETPLLTFVVEQEASLQIAFVRLWIL